MESSDLLQNLFYSSSDSRLVRLEDLSPSDRSWVERVSHALFSDSIIYGVLKTPGELRPVLVRADHELPFLVRFICPEVMLVPEVVDGLSRALHGVCNRFKSPEFLMSVGRFEGCLYYVRSFFPYTLGQLLSRYEYVEIRDVVTVVIKIVKEIHNWHRNGFFHAHLSIENIFIDEAGNISLLDPMIGGATCVALSQLGSEKMPTRYNYTDFAPEVLVGQVGKEADLFAIGQIIAKLLPYSLSGNNRVTLDGTRFGEVISRFSGLSSKLVSSLTERRLKIDEVERELSEILKEIKELGEEDKNYRNKERGLQDVVASAHSDSSSGQDSSAYSSSSEQIKVASGESSGGNSRRNASMGKVVAVGGARKARLESPVPHRPQEGVDLSGQENDSSPLQADNANPRHNASVASSTTFSPNNSTRREPEWLKQRRAANGREQQLPRDKKEGIVSQSKLDVSPIGGESAPFQGSDIHSGVSDIGHVLSPRSPEDVSAVARDDTGRDRLEVEEPISIDSVFQPDHDELEYKESIDELHSDVSEERSVDRRVGLRLNSKSILIVVAVIVFVAVSVFLYVGSTGDSLDIYSSSELAEMWSSQIRSRTDKVVRIALTPENPISEQAQNLIFDSVLQGNKTASPINYDLIRAAMDSRWESSLSKQDRLAVLMYAALQVSQEFRDFAQPNLGGRLHPAVILALTAVIGEREQVSLSKFPAGVLAELPAPVGNAFRGLLIISPKVNCGDREVRLLANIVVHGPSLAEPIFEFLAEDVERRMLVVSQLFLGDEKLAGDFLHTVLNHPNQRLVSSAAVWATKRRLIAWSDLSNVDKLRILTGVVPASPVGSKIVASLFEHPQPSIRQYAIGRALNEIRFEHPAAVSVLAILVKEPALLGPIQTIYLAQILQNPKQEDGEKLKKWLESNPPEFILSEMLLATSKFNDWTVVDREISIYLREHGWKPTKEQLISLIVHPEPLTRLYSYGRVYLLEDKAFALKVLKQARKLEKEEDFKSVLDLNITQLSKTLVSVGIPKLGQ